MIRIGDSKIRSLRLEFNWKEDKLGTIIDILRVGCVVFLLFLFASLVFGCREKAEAEVSTDITIEAFGPNDVALWDETVFLEITLTNEPNFTDSDRIYLYEGDDFNIVIEKNEPNEPGFSIIVPEPPQSNCDHDKLEAIDDYWAFSATINKKGTLIHRQYRCLDCDSNITIPSAVATEHYFKDDD